jgi:PHP family Zn ribbon phosphoesterase
MTSILYCYRCAGCHFSFSSPRTIASDGSCPSCGCSNLELVKQKVEEVPPIKFGYLAPQQDLETKPLKTKTNGAFKPRK